MLFLFAISLIMALYGIYSTKIGKPIPSYALVFFFCFLIYRLVSIFGYSSLVVDGLTLISVIFLLGAVYFLLPLILNSYVWQRLFFSFLLFEEVSRALFPYSLLWISCYSLVLGYSLLGKGVSFSLSFFLLSLVGLYLSSKTQFFQPLIITEIKKEEKLSLANPSWEDMMKIVNLASLKLFGLPVRNKLYKFDYRFPNIAKRYFAGPADLAITFVENPNARTAVTYVVVALCTLTGGVLYQSHEVDLQKRNFLHSSTIEWGKRVEAFQTQGAVLNKKIIDMERHFAEFRLSTQKPPVWKFWKVHSPELVKIQETQIKADLLNLYREKIQVFLNMELLEFKLAAANLSSSNPSGALTVVNAIDTLISDYKLSQQIQQRWTLEQLSILAKSDLEFRLELSNLLNDCVKAFMDGEKDKLLKLIHNLGGEEKCIIVTKSDLLHLFTDTFPLTYTLLDEVLFFVWGNY